MEGTEIECKRGGTDLQNNQTKEGGKSIKKRANTTGQIEPYNFRSPERTMGRLNSLRREGLKAGKKRTSYHFYRSESG